MLELPDSVEPERQRRDAVALVVAAVRMENAVETLETLPPNHAARVAAERAIESVSEAAALYLSICDTAVADAVEKEVRETFGLSEDWPERYRRGEYDAEGQP